MCLAIPGKVQSVEGSMARVDIAGTVRDACITLLPDVKEGDWVIIHAGFAIEKYDEDEAQETLKLLRELADAQERSS